MAGPHQPGRRRRLHRGNWIHRIEELRLQSHVLLPGLPATLRFEPEPAIGVRSPTVREGKHRIASHRFTQIDADSHNDVAVFLSAEICVHLWLIFSAALASAQASDTMAADKISVQIPAPARDDRLRSVSDNRAE